MADTVDPGKYPQAAKLDGLRAQAEAAGQFFEWLMAKPDLYLVRYIGDVPVPASVSGPALVAEFLGIDYKAYELEKLAMLDEIRARHEKDGRVIDTIGPKEVIRQLDSLQGIAERPEDRHTALLIEWLDLRFPAGNQYRHLVLDIADTVRSYALHRYHNADGMPFHQVFQAIGRMRDAMYEDPNALHIAYPREQQDFTDALTALGLYNWHDPDEFAVVYSSGAPGTSGYDLAARMIVHKDNRPVLEVEVARLVEWAAWSPAASSVMP